MLKTAATNMYWKHETKNRAEFSKLHAANLPLSSSGSLAIGGVYLVAKYERMLYTFHQQRSPLLPSDPLIRPELYARSDNYLPNYA